MPGGVSEWLKETGCKPVGSAYAGSNPAPAIAKQTHGQTGKHQASTEEPSARAGSTRTAKATIHEQERLLASARVGGAPGWRGFTARTSRCSVRAGGYSPSRTTPMGTAATGRSPTRRSAGSASQSPTTSAGAALPRARCAGHARRRHPGSSCLTEPIPRHAEWLPQSRDVPASGGAVRLSGAAYGPFPQT
jgi:hypothetical protein